MASSILLRCSLSNLMRTRSRTGTIATNTTQSLLFRPQVRHLSDEIKWVATDVVNPVITGAIIPFSEQNIIQQIIFPYTYPIMYYTDFLLTTCSMPWWMAIIGLTATIKTLTLPVMVKNNVIQIKAYNILPESQKIQLKMNEAIAAGNGYEMAINRTKLKLLNDSHGVGVKERLIPALLQAPAFMTVFLMLRRLAGEPLEAMKTGGVLWFPDLTVPDPFFLLPLLSSATIYGILAYGSEGTAGMTSALGPGGKWLMRAMPVIFFGFTCQFPAALLLFMSTSNLFTMIYAVMLRHPRVKDLFNIPKRLEHPQGSMPLTDRSIKEQFKHAVDMGRGKTTTMDVRRLDDIAFRKAGIGPLKKTYKEPPKKDDEELKL